MFLLVATSYMLCLALWRPRSISLKIKLPGYWENIKSVKTTLVLGIILICVFWVTSGLEFKESKRGALGILGTSEKGFTELNAYFQIVTNIFVHLNLKHLISNLVGLFYLSHYERRVGSGRYLMVFMLSGIFSSLLSMPFHREAIAAGASAGIFGLGAAYFTDYKNLSRREWLYLVFISACLGIIFALPDKHMQDIKIDHWGHFFGAVWGIILCRLLPIPETDTQIKNRNKLRIATAVIIPAFIIISIVSFTKQINMLNKDRNECVSLYRAEKYKEAFELCSKTLGPDADSITARLYARGVGTTKDEVKAFELFKKSAARGDVFAQSYLGWAYKQGSGTEINEDMAFKWSEIAANQSDTVGQLALVLYYNEGIGTKKDIVKAYMWLLVAEKQKYTMSQLPDNARDNILEQHVYFSRVLSEEQTEEAEKLAASWNPTKPKESELLVLYNEEKTKEPNSKAENNVTPQHPAN